VNPGKSGSVLASSYDAVIVGAGFSGLYQLYRLRELGLSVRVIEAGGGVGGTWYWNRYPGARCDSESYTYCYSFSEELLQEWNWSERFASQPEMLRYLEFVADKFDLRQDISFNCRVSAAIYDETSNEWDIEIDHRLHVRARYFITALGPLSAAQLPNIEGIGSFEGLAVHTTQWPHHQVDFTGKRVGVIGTGSTGVQVIQEAAKTARSLTVFQRSPHWATPLVNGPIDEAEMRSIHENYADILARCRSTYGQFIHLPDRRATSDVTAEEREAHYEALYHKPGFTLSLSSFKDIHLDETANATVSDFVARRIRARVHAPAVAERLIPHDRGFATRREPLETGYYEVYNQPNVELVSLRETPITRIVPAGIETTDGKYELDIIVFATGFDAITGPFDRIDIRGVGGRKLADLWKDGPKSYLGMAVHGFPNMLTLMGPHSGGVFCNVPRCIEENVEWITDLIAYMRRSGYSSIEATEEGQQEWTEHVYAAAQRWLMSKVDSWITGINVNRSDKHKRTFLLYTGGSPAFRKRCAEVAANDYEGFVVK
jgi:cation diffusion facilitator CzcD-associated flavoprotein CzcO